KVYLLAAQPRSPHSASRYVTAAMSFRYFNDSHASATRLLQCIDSAHADLVIPISDRDAQICALAQTLRPSPSSFVSAPRESVEVTSSPGATVSLGDRLNIPMPANVAVSDKAQLTERANH